MKLRSRSIWILLLAITLLPLAGCSAPSAQPALTAQPAVSAATAAPPVATPGVPVGSEQLGKLQPSYLMEQGSVLLTPQPDLVSEFTLKPDYKASKPLKIAYIPKHLLAPYFVASDRGSQARCKELGVECTTYAPEKPDNPEEQIRLIEDVINKKVDGIVIFPVDSKAVSPALQKAEAAGIPVVELGTIAYGTRMVTFISADYYSRAFNLGQMLGEAMGGKGNVVTIDGVPGAQNAKDRKAGYLDALKQFPDIKVLASQTGNFKRLEGMKAMENMLQRFPNIDGVVGADDESAIGAIQALQAAGVDLSKVKVIGSDGTHDAVCHILDGTLFATDNSDPSGLAGAGVEVLVRHILDNETFPPEIPWPLPGKKFYVTAETAKEYIGLTYFMSDEEKAAGKCIK